MKNEQTSEMLRKAWAEVFGDCLCFTREILGGVSFRGLLAKSKADCANGILDNDPLMYIGIITDGKLSESHVYLTCKATEAHMAYSSVKLRKTKTVVDPAALVKRFERLKAFVNEHHDLDSRKF